MTTKLQTLRLPHLDRDPTASVWCEDCGAGWQEMPEDAIHEVPGCDARGYYGAEPDEHYTVCPACYHRNSLVERPRWIYRATKRSFGRHAVRFN